MAVAEVGTGWEGAGGKERRMEWGQSKWGGMWKASGSAGSIEAAICVRTTASRFDTVQGQSICMLPSTSFQSTLLPDAKGASFQQPSDHHHY